MKIYLNSEGRGISGVLASPLLTLASIIALFASISLYPYLAGRTQLTLLLIPTVALMINFLALLFVRGAFSAKPALLLFHFCLFSLVILAIIGQLTYLKATLELSSMEAFDGRLENVEAGLFHDYQLDREKFSNLGFSISYRPGIKRDSTVNRIQLETPGQKQRVVEIGDHIPLVLGHYRLYTTHNKGYSPLFRWFPDDNSPSQLGSVHLPAYPINEYKQAREWTPPGSQQQLWTMLVMEEDVLPENREFNFSIPYRHHLVIRIGEDRNVLRVGEEIRLDSGILRYESLTSWMGYKVDYDWTRPWLLATCLIGLVSLSLYYLNKLRRL